MENKPFLNGDLTPGYIARVENEFKKKRRQANTWERLQQIVPPEHYEELYAYDQWLAENRLGWVLNYPKLDEIFSPGEKNHER